MYNLMYPHDQEELNFYNSYFNIKPENCASYLYSNNIDQDVLDVYVITFNSPFCVEYQIKTIRMFLKQKYNIIIIDNNCDLYPEVSNKVLEICKKEKVTYIKAPNNLFQRQDRFDPSIKLGVTMNWVYLNCAKDRRAKYFGFLDHDCFLFKDCDLQEYLDTKYMYGQVSISTKFPAAWNLHVTSNFYKYDYVKDLILDFRPSHKWQLDTGGANYDILYNSLNYKDYELIATGFRYFDYDIGPANSMQHYHMHDKKWIHMNGGTRDGVDIKVPYMKGFLDCVLNSKFF